MAMISQAHLPWRLSIVLPLLVAAPLAAQMTTVTTSPCEAVLVRPTADPLGYKVRTDDRCEGIYVREVAGSGGFSVVAFTTTGEPFSIQNAKPLVLEWPTVADAPVFVRAVSLRRRMYYRMDLRRPAGIARFEWPTDVLTALKLAAEELGVVAWNESRIGDTAQDVYLPLRITNDATSVAPDNYIVQVVNGVELRDLFVRLATVDAAGHEDQVLVRDESLRRGFYPAERAIPIRLPPLKIAGLYRLQLNAVLSSGAPASRTVYFRHASR
jgi:hypothetical protein